MRMSILNGLFIGCTSWVIQAEGLAVTTLPFWVVIGCSFGIMINSLNGD